MKRFGGRSSVGGWLGARPLPLNLLCDIAWLVFLCSDLSERIDCLDAILEKMIHESQRSDELDSYITCAVIGQDMRD